MEGALAAGHVGAPLHPGDKALLRLRPLRHYEPGELVALKRRLAAASLPGQAAAAAAEARATAGPSSAAAGAGGGGDDGGAVLCYGRVAVDAAPQPGQAAYRLSVEVAPGVYESVLSTQVCGGVREGWGPDALHVVGWVSLAGRSPSRYLKGSPHWC